MAYLIHKGVDRYEAKRVSEAERTRKESKARAKGGSSSGSLLSGFTCSTCNLQVRATIDLQVRATIDLQVRATIDLQVRATIDLQVRATIDLQVRATIGLQVRATIDLQVRATIDLQVRATIDLQVRATIDLSSHHRKNMNTFYSGLRWYFSILRDEQSVLQLVQNVCQPFYLGCVMVRSTI